MLSNDQIIMALFWLNSDLMILIWNTRFSQSDKLPPYNLLLNVLFDNTSHYGSKMSYEQKWSPPSRFYPQHCGGLHHLHAGGVTQSSAQHNWWLPVPGQLCDKEWNGMSGLGVLKAKQRHFIMLSHVIFTTFLLYCYFRPLSPLLMFNNNICQVSNTFLEKVRTMSDLYKSV